ncbi:MAG: hypothetical protein GY786_16925 [Proteobacteria bacterium]|nr:hypothetical protein [Pseudomonadota bacterium]
MPQTPHFFKESATKRSYQYLEDRYKIVTNGAFQEVIYKPEGNKLFVVENPYNFYKVLDAGNERYKIHYIEFLQETEQVLGYTTEGIKLFFEGGSKLVFFSDQLRVDPVAYKYHSWNHLDILSNHSGSIPLKTVTEIDGIQYIETATSIDLQKTKAVDFALNHPVARDQSQEYYPVEIKGLYRVDIPVELTLEESLTNDFTIVYENQAYGMSVVLIDLSKKEIEEASLSGFKSFILENLSNSIPNLEIREDLLLKNEEEVQADRIQFFGDVEGERRYYCVGAYETNSHFVGIITESSLTHDGPNEAIMNQIVSSFKLP